MTIAFTELLNESGPLDIGGGDFPGTLRANSTSRRFLVPGPSRDSVMNNPDLLAAAAAGVPHPTIPGLISTGFTVTGDFVGGGPDASDTGWYVTANYAPAGTPTFDFPAPDRQNLSFVSSGFAPFEKHVNFPIQTGVDIIAPSDAGPTIVRMWQGIEDKTVTVNALALQIEFNMPSMTAGDIGAIYAQMNKLHSFRGGVWLFKPQSADILYRDSVWNVVFRWESDPGHGPAELAEFANDPDFCLVEPRPPHAEWYVVTKVWPPLAEASPRLIAKTMHELVPAGYQTLPGYGTVWNL